MAFYTRCAKCGKRVEAWDKDLSHPHYCFNCNVEDDTQLVTCSNCGAVTDKLQLDVETEKMAGQYTNSYFCPKCHEYIGYDVQDGTREGFPVVDSSFTP